MLRRAVREGKKFSNPVPTTVGGFSTFFKVLPRFLTNRAETVPKQALGPFKTDAGVYATPPASGLRVTWMGHSQVLMEIDGATVLMDPVWDERASPMSWAGPKRFFAAPLSLEEMPPVDVVIVSHDHYDHLGEKTIRTLAKMDRMRETEWVTSLGVGDVLREFGVAKKKITELDWTDGVKTAGIEITAVPTRHFSGRSMFNRFETLWSGFVIRGAKHNVYFGADSGWWDGFAQIGAEYGPFDLTMLEIGAFDEMWNTIHLGPDGAVRAFEAMGGNGLLMPIHWGLFDLALHDWRQPITRLMEVARERGIAVWTPEPGVPAEVVVGRELHSRWW